MTEIPEHEHNRPVFSFRPPKDLNDWARQEATRLDMRPGEYLIHLMASERDRREGR